jgi:hypothetical protein
MEKRKAVAREGFEEAEDIKGMPFSKSRLMDLLILPIADKIIAYYDDNLYFWGK